MTSYNGTSDTVWYSWTINSTTSTNVECTYVDSAWSNWTTGSDVATSSDYTSTVTLTWESWTGEYQIADCISVSDGYNIAQETEEERQEREAEAQRQREQRAAQAEERKRKREEANQRAKELLTSMLEEEQKAQYEEVGSFVIHTKDKSYMIAKGRVGNVFELDQEGERVARLCAHPRLNVPDEDTMLAQKLMLETDEARFLQIANRTPIRTL